MYGDKKPFETKGPIEIGKGKETNNAPVKTSPPPVKQDNAGKPKNK